jgi:hypothetical protein
MKSPESRLLARRRNPLPRSTMIHPSEFPRHNDDGDFFVALEPIPCK